MINVCIILNMHILDAQECLLVRIHNLKMFEAVHLEGFLI